MLIQGVCEVFVFTDVCLYLMARRIGAYYSPSAITLTKDVLKERIKGSSFSSPLPTKSQMSVFRSNSRMDDFETADGGYNYYKEVRSVMTCPLSHKTCL